MTIFLIFVQLLFDFNLLLAKEKVFFGGTEIFPTQIFKDKALAMKGMQQIVSQILLEDTPYQPHWVEMTNLRQQKELSKKGYFCRVNTKILDSYKITRKFSSIEEYINEDLKKVKYETLTTLPYFFRHLPGFVAIREDQIQKFKKYFKGSYQGRPALDGIKLLDQKDLKTGFIPASTDFPPLLLNAGINKKIWALETVMDFEHNFFRMVESGRIDFYFDAQQQFTDFHKKQGTVILARHPELKVLVSLRVEALDIDKISYLQCSSSSAKIVKLMDEKIKKITKTEESLKKFIATVFQYVFTKEQIEARIKSDVSPMLDFFKKNKAITTDL